MCTDNTHMPAIELQHSLRESLEDNLIEALVRGGRSYVSAYDMVQEIMSSGATVGFCAMLLMVSA